MPWSQELSPPVKLKDGRVLITLRHAANLFGSFSDPIVAHGWVSHAIELLIEAAEDGSTPGIYKATVQVQRAPFRERML